MRKTMLRWLLALVVVLPCLLMTAEATEQAIPEGEDVLRVTGFITANQATGEPYTEVGGVRLNLETGADMLGFYVTAYYDEAYKSERHPGTAYSVVVQCSCVRVDEDIFNDQKAFRAAFNGFPVDVNKEDVVVFNEEGQCDSSYNWTFDPTSYTADAGLYVLHPETDALIGYIAPVSTSVNVVNRITDVDGGEYIKLGALSPLSNTIYEDEVVEYEGIAEDDIVIVKRYGSMTHLERPQVITGKVTGKSADNKYTYIDGQAYANAELPGGDIFDWAAEDLYADEERTYNFYLYDDYFCADTKLIGANMVPYAPEVEEAVYVVDSYSTTVTDVYGNKTNSYYAQGVNMAGEEVNILIGIDGVYEGEEDVVVRELATGFYTFEPITHDSEQAAKGIMKSIAALSAWEFNIKYDKFFVVTENVEPQERDCLTKQDKYLNSDDGLLFLTDDTRFILVNSDAVGGPLEIVTRTGGISKDVYEDVIAVVAIADELGNYIADTVVITTSSMGLKAEDYIYLPDGSDYAVIAHGYEYSVYFTEANEFKTIVTDTTYETGFYGHYTIDGDGVYDLSLTEVEGTYVALSEKLIGIYNTSITTDDDLSLLEAAGAKIIDVRSEKEIENSAVSSMETLEDLACAFKAGGDVYFNVLLEEDGADMVVSHIFVYHVDESNLGSPGVSSPSYVPEDAVYVVDNYCLETDDAYGKRITSYYAQGVNMAGEEVNILIGIDGLYGGDVVTALAPGFYTFEIAPDLELADKGVMLATPAPTAADFDESVTEFFAVTGVTPQEGFSLTRQDKYLNSDDGLLFLTDDTRFILVEENATVDSLEIVTRTGGIAKDVAGDTIAVAATVDEYGNRLAAVVVLITPDVNIKAEDYIYVLDGNDYALTANGYEYNVYFTETDEFKSIVTDSYYDAGFYGNYTIDEDGVYELSVPEVEGTYVALFEELIGIYNTSITTDDELSLAEAAGAKIVDTRPMDKAFGARFESFEDLKLVLKGDQQLFFNALLEEDGADMVITHIFVTSLKTWSYDNVWVEDSFNKAEQVNYYNISVGEVTNGEVYVSRKIAPEGYTVIVSAQPDTDYMVECILVDGVAIGGDRFAATGDHVVTATFAPISGLGEETLRVTGFVTANQATTGEPYTEVGYVRLNLETGTDMLGHYVTAYYDEAYVSESHPGVAHAVVERAVYVTVKEDIYDRETFENAFGAFAIVTSGDAAIFDSTGRLVSTTDVAWTFDWQTYTASAGTYVIDKESGWVIGYMAPIAASVNVVTEISTEEHHETIQLGSDTLLENNDYWDEVVEYDGIAKGDVVIVKRYQDMTHLEKPQVIMGQVDKVWVDDGCRYTGINGQEYVNASLLGAATEWLIESDTLVPSSREYMFYIYDGKLLGARPIPQSIHEAIYVVNNYYTVESNAYGMDTCNYYAQGVNMAGEEVNVLIGVENAYGDEVGVVVRALATGFYTFELSGEKEQASKGVMVATAVKTAADFDEIFDGFFAVTDGVVPQNGTTLTRRDEYLTSAESLLYLTTDTKFVLIKESTIVDKLEISTHTGAISKEVAGDTIAVVATVDEFGNRVADTVVIVTSNMQLKANDYIYLPDGDGYVVTEHGYGYDVYFTDTNEFKAIVTDHYYVAGFYGDYTIGEDGVYNLGLASESSELVKYNQQALSAYGNSIAATDLDYCLVADNAKILDLRPEDVLEDSYIAPLESFTDIKSALKTGGQIYFNALLEQQDDEYVVTHIFVYEVTEPECYAISVGAVNGGSIRVNLTDAYYGEQVTVTATPDEGYVLKRILVDGEAINGNTFTVTGDHVVTAEFEKKAPAQSSIFGYFSLEVIKTIEVDGQKVNVCRWVWTPFEG